MASRGGSRYFKAVSPRRYSDTGSDVERGMQAGQQVGKLIGGLAGAIKGMRQDAAANSLMTGQNISAQPGAGVTQDLGTLPADTGAASDDSWTLPDSSALAGDTTGTVGGLLGTGGVAEMKARQQMESDQLDTAIKKARLADELAKTGGTGRYARRATPAEKGVTVSGATSPWSGAGSGPSADGTTSSTTTTKGGRAQKYVPGSSDVENDPSSDDPTKIRADYEAYHPGSDFGDFSRVSPDPTTGDYVIKDKNDQIVETVPKAEGDIYRMRMDAAKRKAGLPYTPSVIGKPGDPSLGAAGTQGNPIIPQGQLHLRSLPAGTWVQDPNTGQKYMIQKQPRS